MQQQSSVALGKQDQLEQINLLQAELHKEAEIIRALQHKTVNYSRLNDVVERLSLSLTLSDTSATLSSAASQLFGQQDITTILYLFHSRTGELGLSASQKGQMQINIKSKKGDIFDQWVVKTLQPLLVEDSKSDFRFDVDKISSEGEESREIRSVMSVPLLSGHKILGILRVDSVKEHCFNTEDLQLLMTVSDLGAVAIENAQLYEHIEDLAIRDGLTGLFLRRYLLERMSQEITRELRTKGEISFLMIDLDFFKRYNDQFGHTAGDIVLRTIATILAQHFNRPGDLVCRYGGEEFAVLLPDCSKERAVKEAEMIRKKIESQSILLRREKTSITVSIGVANLPKDSQLKEELIHLADQAMYRAKEKGRNRVESVHKK